MLNAYSHVMANAIGLRLLQALAQSQDAA